MKNSRDNTPPVPDLILRDAYLKFAEQKKEWRESFVARTENIELIRQELGPAYAHVPIDWYRARIPHCCKRPSAHGGGWGKKHGPSKNHKTKKEAYSGSLIYRQKLLARRDWPLLRAAARKRDGGRCRICNSPHSLHCHHRCYESWEKPGEINDLTTLCSNCHEVVTTYCRLYKEEAV